MFYNVHLWRKCSRNGYVLDKLGRFIPNGIYDRCILSGDIFIQSIRGFSVNALSAEIVGEKMGALSLQSWKLQKHDESGNPLAISKSFEFKDFTTAFLFMSLTALQAEKMNHHRKSII